MADPDVKLARDVLTETLHGPVPMRTVARLAEAVIRLHEAAQWRPLTSAPKTWPKEGQQVIGLSARGHPHLFRWSGEGDAEWVDFWLPLPEPPK